MEKLKKLLEFLSPLPSWLRVVIAALVTVIVSVCVLMTACTVVSSCGITQSVVNNIESDGNTIEMGVTPSTTTSTTASPEIPINAPLTNSMWLVFVTLITSAGSAFSHKFCVSAKNKQSVRNVFADYISSSSFIVTISSYRIHGIVQMPDVTYLSPCDFSLLNKSFNLSNTPD